MKEKIRLNDTELNDDRKSQNFVKNGKVYILGDFDDTISKYVIPDFLDLLSDVSIQKNPLIPVYINSYGGEADKLFSLLSLFDIARASNIKILTNNIGVAYSCGSLLAVSGDIRLMSRNARNLMHLGTDGRIASTYEQLDRTYKDTKSFFDTIVRIYTERTKMTEKKIKEVLKDDLYFLGAKECLKLGLCDQVV